MKTRFSILILILIANLVTSVTKFNSYECANPNNKLGVCISLYACPTVLKHFLSSPGIPEDDAFLYKSYCENGFGAAPFVCCTNEISFSNDSSSTDSDKDNYFNTRANVLATQEECTRDAYLSLAAWKVQHVTCVGSLINNRYILTTAWCAEYAEGRILYLGKSNTDELGIERRIGHEHYGSSTKHQFIHDIGLLRLSQSVQFSAEVAPICLPIVVTNYRIGDSVRLPARNGNDINLKQGGSIVENCYYRWTPSSDQLCVSGDILKNHFDYGTPMVAKHNGAWVIDALYGFYPDTLTYHVFTRVPDYKSWILNNLEP